MNKIIEYKIPSTEKIVKLKSNDNVFISTITGDLIIKSAIKSFKKDKTILDSRCCSISNMHFFSKTWLSM